MHISLHLLSLDKLCIVTNFYQRLRMTPKVISSNIVTSPQFHAAAKYQEGAARKMKIDSRRQEN